MAKRQTTILSACGEHYVASFLSAMEVVVALTRAGTPSTDMLVTTGSGGRSVSIQVKTARAYNHVTYKKKPEKNYRLWRVGTSAINYSNDFHWYAFVSVGEWPMTNEQPLIFFVPSKDVVKALHANAPHEDWFAMLDSDLEQYIGITGFEKLGKLLDDQTPKP